MKASAPESVVGSITELSTRSQSHSSSSSTGLALDTFSTRFEIISDGKSAVTTAPRTEPTIDEILDEAVLAVSKACYTCEKHPKVVELVDRWLERSLDGTLKGVHFKAIYLIARSTYRYNRSRDTLRRHIENCRAENYRRLRGGE